MSYTDNDAQDHRACLGIDPKTGNSSTAGTGPLAPPLQFAAGKFEVQAGKPVACAADGTCRPLGKRAAKAAIAANRAGRAPTVASDGALVVVTGGEGHPDTVWNVLKDRRLELEPFSDATDDYAQSGQLRLIGRNVLGSSTPCAGPCTVHWVYSATGAVLADKLQTEDSPVPIDDKRWTLLADKLWIFDLETGKPIKSINVFPDDGRYVIDGVKYHWAQLDPRFQTPVLPLGNGLVALVFRSEPVIALVNVDTGTLVRRIRYPVCGDTDAADDVDRVAEPNETK